MTEERDEQTREMVEMARELYHPPPPTPRDEIWDRIRPRIPGEASSTPDHGREDGPGQVLEFRHGRDRKPKRLILSLGWAAAASVILLVGIGIGRSLGPSSPAPGTGTVTFPAETEAAATTGPSVPLRHAAVSHLARTESLLAMVRAEGRSGSLHPEIGPWARELLAETRLFLDASGPADPALEELMEDLELVLAQIVGVAETDNEDQGRARTELDLALDGLENQKIMTRIQAVS